MRVLPLVALVAFTPTPAWAEPDTFALGDGHHGSLTLTDGGLVESPATPVVENVLAGAFDVVVGSTLGFQAGDLALVVQSAEDSLPPDAGDPGPFDLAMLGAGRWELARIASVTGARLRFTAPMTASFPAVATQAVRVAEFETATIAAGTTVNARPWDGSSGGIVALFVKGTLTVDGRITASAAGFRGARWVPTYLDTGIDCSMVDLAPPRGAQKGEGLWSARAAPSGRGNVGNAGGGGNCLAGGGGGAHRGAGGSAYTVGAGGLGGAPLVYDFNRLVFGGGGGAGGRSDGRTPANGGSGGGVIFIRAAELAGQGTLSAAGGDGPSGADVSSAGSGAGGSIRVQVRGHASCTLLDARGGSSGITRFDPGGGGGGGQIVAQARSSSCPTLASAGLGTEGRTPPYGPFDPGYFGQVIELLNGFTAPQIPVITSPAARSLVQAKPPISGTAESNSQVKIYVDGLEVAQTTADADGGFTVTPSSEMTDGPHRLQASATVGDVSSALSEPILITVMSGNHLEARCSCQAPGASAAVLAMCWLFRRRRRSRSDPCVA